MDRTALSMSHIQTPLSFVSLAFDMHKLASALSKANGPLAFVNGPVRKAHHAFSVPQASQPLPLVLCPIRVAVRPPTHSLRLQLSVFEDVAWKQRIGCSFKLVQTFKVLGASAPLSKSLFKQSAALDSSKE